MVTRRPEDEAAQRRWRWRSPQGRAVFYGLVAVLATGEFVVLSTGFPHRVLAYSGALLVGLGLGGLTWGRRSWQRRGAAASSGAATAALGLATVATAIASGRMLAGVLLGVVAYGVAGFLGSLGDTRHHS